MHTAKGKVITGRAEGSIILSASNASDGIYTIYNNVPKSADICKSRQTSAVDLINPTETIETIIKTKVPQNIGEICSQELRTINTNQKQITEEANNVSFRADPIGQPSYPSMTNLILNDGH